MKSQIMQRKLGSDQQLFGDEFINGSTADQLSDSIRMLHRNMHQLLSSPFLGSKDKEEILKAIKYLEELYEKVSNEDSDIQTCQKDYQEFLEEYNSYVEKINAIKRPSEAKASVVQEDPSIRSLTKSPLKNSGSSSRSSGSSKERFSLFKKKKNIELSDETILACNLFTLYRVARDYNMEDASSLIARLINAYEQLTEDKNSNKIAEAYPSLKQEVQELSGGKFDELFAIYNNDSVRSTKGFYDKRNQLIDKYSKINAKLNNEIIGKEIESLKGLQVDLLYPANSLRALNVAKESLKSLVKDASSKKSSRLGRSGK